MPMCSNKSFDLANFQFQLQLDYTNSALLIVTSNSIPFLFDLPFIHLLSAISKFCHFLLYFISPESLKKQGSTVLVFCFLLFIGTSSLQ